ncbi:uncharacterized protein LOC117180437 [Belonocnema kinseyi]|uniref:uncharacterized protein LOC117180437 n=1 Tax=Belonocnema kinseyi TaxID=2817044 RepID=UPI00143D6FC1|nr:uncharacterized protein LOC117180437 [Belonocnema kinseyi]
MIVLLPTEEEGRNILKFKNHKYKENVPFAVYADIECLLEPVTNSQIDKAAYQKHIPTSVAYYTKRSFNDSTSEPKVYREKDCIEWFIKELKDLAVNVNSRLQNPVPMEKLTSKQKQDFQNAKLCHICEKGFKKDDVKHRDHCHFTCKYCGPAHGSCNINYKDFHIIPVVLHNLSGYDSHFFIIELAQSFEGHVSLLPVNEEKYISFTKYVPNPRVKLRFIDSFRFMPCSLKKLASYLNHSAKTITRKFCKNDSEYNLLTRKGVFPYKYIDSWKKLEEGSLPPKEAVYSKLNDLHISDEDYQPDCKVWETFNLQNLGQYSDLYLKTDVLLLADIFENFRKTCFATYKLGPLHYYTAMGLSFVAMLKYTGIKLLLLTDVEMLLLIQKAIRGGVSQCFNRFAKANNRFMEEDCNPYDPESYIFYLDIKNQYGKAISEFLPYQDFEWFENFENVPSFFNAPDDSPEGYILEVDLEYPEELHDLYKDLPLCTEHFVPPGSKYQILKLVTNLLPKKNCVLHY